MRIRIRRVRIENVATDIHTVFRREIRFIRTFSASFSDERHARKRFNWFKLKNRKCRNFLRLTAGNTPGANYSTMSSHDASSNIPMVTVSLKASFYFCCSCLYSNERIFLCSWIVNCFFNKGKLGRKKWSCYKNLRIKFTWI